MRYAVVIEKAGDNFSAYVPDLPGCVATGTSVEAIEHEIRDGNSLSYRRLKRRRTGDPGSNKYRQLRRSLTNSYCPFSIRSARLRWVRSMRSD